MINSIDTSGSVAVAQAGTFISERSVAEAVAVPKINPDAPWIQSKNKVSGEDSVDIQGLYGVLRTSKDAVNRVASEIRGLGEAKTLVSRVRDSLELIVKSFPPFPPGSLEREQFLNSVAGIRAMIERLTFPPAQGKAIAETLSGEAFVNSNASDQTLFAGLDHVGALAGNLSVAQSRLSDAIQVGKINNQAEDAQFVEQSQGVGQALSSGKLSIGQETRLILGMLT